MSPIQSFSPSAMSAEVLESIFVKRHGLVSRIQDQLREHAAGKSASNFLLVGPRGIGKTHLISLLWHRVKADEACADLRVAWLKEDEWGVASYVDLVVRMLRALHPEDDDWLDALEDDATPANATRLLEEMIGDHRVVFFLENLDRLLDGIGSDGQHELRAFAENTPQATFVATSPAAPRVLSSRRHPLFGFFERIRLEPLSFEEACDLLVRLARHHGDEALARFITTPTGRSRVRAVDHLAGGSPRVYVVLSEFLTEDALEQLVDSFIEALVRLTPYYQAKMESVSAQQRKIIEFLVDRKGRVRVAEIAKKCLMSPQVTSRQLKSLKDLGLVTVQSRGRNSLYEIAEPLMGMCLDVKSQRSESVELVVEIIRLWFGRVELLTKLQNVESIPEGLRAQLIEATRSSKPSVVADHAAKAVHAAFSAGDFPRALDEAAELVRVRGNLADHILLATAHLTTGSTYAILDGLERSFDDPRWNDDFAPPHPATFAVMAYLLAYAGAVDDARRLLDTVRPVVEGHVERFVEVGLAYLVSAEESADQAQPDMVALDDASVHGHWLAVFLATENYEAVARWAASVPPFVAVSPLALIHARGGDVRPILEATASRASDVEEAARVGIGLLLERYVLTTMFGADDSRTKAWIQLEEDVQSRHPGIIVQGVIEGAVERYAETGDESHLDGVPEVVRKLFTDQKMLAALGRLVDREAR
ncbi:MAG: MarR family transcriptional regulator [Deltaproteobacteria bacterium]